MNLNGEVVFRSCTSMHGLQAVGQIEWDYTHEIESGDAIRMSRPNLFGQVLHMFPLVSSKGLSTFSSVRRATALVYHRPSLKTRDRAPYPNSEFHSSAET